MAVLIAALIILLAGGTFGGYKLYKHFSKLPPEPVQQAVAPPDVPPPPLATTGPSPLTGLEVDLELIKRPVTGVMIENSPDARPQAGLTEAGVVYEAIAEGGITRFLALFQEARPSYIGPVRSARPYYVEWALSYDASYAHVGGSPEALKRIKSLDVKDLDQFANSGAYERVSNRFSPHNVYTSMDKLDDLNKAKGYKGSDFTPFKRKKAEPSKEPTAQSIDLTISSANYNVHYDYDAEHNSYDRVMGGRAHKDERSGKQVSPKVVIAIVTTKKLHSDGKHTVYGTTGEGSVYVFQDGKVSKGTWKRNQYNSQYVFYNKDGKVIPLNPGQTWITLLDANSKVSY